MSSIRKKALLVAVLAMCAHPAWCQGAAYCVIARKTDRGVHMRCGAGVIDVEIFASNILRVDVQPEGRTSPRTLVLQPSLKMPPVSGISVHSAGAVTKIRSSRMSVLVHRSGAVRISVADAQGQALVEQRLPLEEARSRRAVFLHPAGESLYGMRGIGLASKDGGLIRDDGREIAAGAQGDAGGPFFFTTRYGLLIDSDGGAFDTTRDRVVFRGGSRADLEYFVLVGGPMVVMSALADLTGHPPMPPKWTLGFLNSQWGSNESEIVRIASLYRQKHIPLDAFILDFDWKAWGEDDYGEWRWNNSTFPAGANGKFAKHLREQGIKLAGILKPRLVLYKQDGASEMQAAAYAEHHGFWYPGEPSYIDYASKRPARDLDFARPEVRAWFWKHLEPAFASGIIAWWNDEADFTNTDDKTFDFNNFQFLNMGRMLYEGQRGSSDLRVCSLNRNFYLGAQRYGYAEWSGDISTGFENMQRERVRMLATVNLGEPHWSMDSGGFIGHPSPENYARWMEFAAFVPMDRVHGEFGEKRQPWIYGEKAEAAAARAIRLRYSLLPYLYSCERMATETGIGLVRPLFWAFPGDSRAASEVSSWMFGDALLVSPVVTANASLQRVYLPAGIWYDYFRGARFTGGQVIDYPLAPDTWLDIPLFVRAGSIVASQDVQDYVDQSPPVEVTLDVFPSLHPARFVYYDDDGVTYAYEQNVFSRQVISASVEGKVIRMRFDAPTGSFTPALRTFLVKVHGSGARRVWLDGKPLGEAQFANQVTKSNGNGWTNSSDHFGRATILRIPALRKLTVTIQPDDRHPSGVIPLTEMRLLKPRPFKTSLQSAFSATCWKLEFSSRFGVLLT